MVSLSLVLMSISSRQKDFLSSISMKQATSGSDQGTIIGAFLKRYLPGNADHKGDEVSEVISFRRCVKLRGQVWFSSILQEWDTG